jgi:hypothetical protein
MEVRVMRGMMTQRSWSERGRAGAVSLATAMVAAGCVTTPPEGVITAPLATVLPQDSRATQFGATAAEILKNPRLEDKVRALFSADWTGGRPGGTTMGAEQFFARSAPPRMVRVGTVDYLAVTGCHASACARDRALLLVRADGNELLGRIDEGGFIHYYGYGTQVDMGFAGRERVNAAWKVIAPPG